MRTSIPRAAAAASLAFALSACVTLLPKAPPAQLYSFGGDASAGPGNAGTGVAPATAPGAGRRTTVVHEATTFVPAAAGDRLLTMRGLEAAYVSQGRWISPAADLFDAAEARAFAGGAAVDLTPQAEPAGARVGLQLDVLTFEARFDPGVAMTGETPPTVVVRVRAELVNLADRRPLGATTLESRQPAAANRIGSIAAGFDAATRDVLRQTVAWTTSTLATAPVTPASARPG